ncbi:hypothetical protein FQN54_003665 [Arachnomyces sp. PD_36]|nr:hypothetical protein FQN54_003665 [Arachnomyces sp. PD_36]
MDELKEAHLEREEEDEEEEEEEQFQEYREVRSSFWVSDRDPSDLLKIGRSGAKWRLVPVFAERVFHDYDEPQKAHISEVSATCLATQVEGRKVGKQAIVKIRKQIPTDAECPEDVEPEDLARTKPCRYGIWASYEFYNYKRLGELRCRCTPKLLGHKLVSQSEDDDVPGGFILYLLIQKLPGRNLVNFGDLPISERDEVRLAFAKAIREFYALGYKHDDPDRRNLIWNPKKKKCYIIDLEDAYHIDDGDQPKRFKPAIDWMDWALASPTYIMSDGIDPMYPWGQFSLVDPGDDALRKMATDAAGKDVYKPPLD